MPPRRRRRCRCGTHAVGMVGADRACAGDRRAVGVRSPHPALEPAAAATHATTVSADTPRPSNSSSGSRKGATHDDLAVVALAPGAPSTGSVARAQARSLPVVAEWRSPAAARLRLRDVPSQVPVRGDRDGLDVVRVRRRRRDRRTATAVSVVELSAWTAGVRRAVKRVGFGRPAGERHLGASFRVAWAVPRGRIRPDRVERTTARGNSTFTFGLCDENSTSADL